MRTPPREGAGRNIRRTGAWMRDLAFGVAIDDGDAEGVTMESVPLAPEISGNFRHSGKLIFLLDGISDFRSDSGLFRGERRSSLWNGSCDPGSCGATWASAPPPPHCPARPAVGLARIHT